MSRPAAAGAVVPDSDSRVVVHTTLLIAVLARLATLRGGAAVSLAGALPSWAVLAAAAAASVIVVGTSVLLSRWRRRRLLPSLVQGASALLATLHRPDRRQRSA